MPPFFLLKICIFPNRVESRFVVLKIQKSASHYTEAARDEVEMLTHICEKDPNNDHFCVHLFDNFVHHGPNGARGSLIFCQHHFSIVIFLFFLFFRDDFFSPTRY
jgi:hypothetical protein